MRIRTRRKSALTEQTAERILRSETDIVRAAVEEQARGLRQEFVHTLNGFQDVTLKAFATLRDGIDGQIRSFGERLDAGVKATAEGVGTISTELDHRHGANSNRSKFQSRELAGPDRKKLDHNITQQSESAKASSEVLIRNFEWLSIQVRENSCGNGSPAVRTTGQCDQGRHSADRQVGEGTGEFCVWR